MATRIPSDQGGRSTNARIKITRNGPYMVSGGVPVAEQAIVSDAEGTAIGWQAGRNIPVRETYALCRCGQSKNKPFCDGSHLKVNFDGTETASRKPYLQEAEETKGPTLKLTDVPSLCAGAGFCHRAGGTWELVAHSDDPAKKKIAMEEACDCPGGRLVAWEENGQAIEPVLEPAIRLVTNPHAGGGGPIQVRGGIPVESSDSTIYETRNRVTLCRCGKSANKPFCDASHSDV